MRRVRVKLVFPESLIREPVIGQMTRRFDVLPNIRRASVEDSVGWIVCELEGPDDTVEAAVAWLRETGVQVERLADVLEG